MIKGGIQMRHALIERNTKETQIRLELELDGVGKADRLPMQISLMGFIRHRLHCLG